MDGKWVFKEEQRKDDAKIPEEVKLFKRSMLASKWYVRIIGLFCYVIGLVTCVYYMMTQTQYVSVKVVRSHIHICTYMQRDLSHSKRDLLRLRYKRSMLASKWYVRIYMYVYIHYMCAVCVCIHMHSIC